MKLMTLRFGDRFHVGVRLGSAVLDLVAIQVAVPLAAQLSTNMKGLIAMGADGLSLVERVIKLAEAEDQDRLREIGALIAFEAAILGPVVPDPDLVLSGSMNSLGHVAEMGDIPPEYPCAFHKVRSALSASGADIVPPPGHSDMLDWEGEFCVVIGKRCHNVGLDEAPDYVFGYTLLNDVSAREYVLPFVAAKGASNTAQAWERNVLGKNYPTFAPIGPVIVTKDEFPSPLAYHLQTLVNGEVMQSSTQEDLVFGPVEMISYFSQFYFFEPGDIISMGSPPGVGVARKPPLFLKPGDTVEIRVDGIGSLINRVRLD